MGFDILKVFTVPVEAVFRAEVVSYEDLMAAGTYAEASKRGAVRLEGKIYLVQDGDIINFRFNV